ncbi:MAG: DegT/DnrJ/EryC1/StrS family aminotransferase [Terriglobia bacterium]
MLRYAQHDSTLGCGRYFGPIHWQPAYRSAPPPGVCLPVTEQAASRTLALPFFNRITGEQMDEVCAALLEALERIA